MKFRRIGRFNSVTFLLIFTVRFYNDSYLQTKDIISFIGLGVKADLSRLPYCCVFPLDKPFEYAGCKWTELRIYNSPNYFVMLYHCKVNYSDIKDYAICFFF